MLRTLAQSTAAVLLSTLALGASAHAQDAPAPVATPAPAPGTAPEAAPEAAEMSSLEGVQDVSESPAGPKIMVIGDSITAWYRDKPGSAKQGWWSILARDPKVDASRIATYAEGGSGMNVRGNKCRGTSFGSRTKYVKAKDVDFLIIAGGRNDYNRCDSKNRKKRLTTTQQRAGIKKYMAHLDKHVREKKIPHDHVLVMTPWGKTQRSTGTKIQSYVKHYAEREGFTYVSTKTLPKSYTIDNKHPNLSGSKYLAKVMTRALLDAS